jgi:hypothetical protein
MTVTVSKHGGEKVSGGFRVDISRTAAKDVSDPIGGVSHCVRGAARRHNLSSVDATTSFSLQSS